MLIQQGVSFIQKSQAHRKVQKPLPCLACRYQILKTNAGAFCLELKQTKMNSDRRCVKSTMKNRWIRVRFFGRLKDDCCKHKTSSEYVLYPRFLLGQRLGDSNVRCDSLFCSTWLVSRCTGAGRQPCRRELCSLVWKLPSLFIFKCVFDCWIPGNFLSLQQELCHCPKKSVEETSSNLRRKRVFSAFQMHIGGLGLQMKASCSCYWITGPASLGLMYFIQALWPPPWKEPALQSRIWLRCVKSGG